MRHSIVMRGECTVRSSAPLTVSAWAGVVGCPTGRLAVQQRGRSNGFVLSVPPLLPRLKFGLCRRSTWSFTSPDLHLSESCPYIGDGQSEEVMAAEQLQRAGTRSVSTFAVLVALLSGSPATSPSLFSNQGCYLVAVDC